MSPGDAVPLQRGLQTLLAMIGAGGPRVQHLSIQGRRGAAGGHTGCRSWRRFLLNQIFFLFFTLWMMLSVGLHPAHNHRAGCSPERCCYGCTLWGSVQSWGPHWMGGMETPWASSDVVNEPIRRD